MFTRALLASTLFVGAAAAIPRHTPDTPRPVTPSTVARPAPEWRNTSWLNAAAPVTLTSLHGRVVLLNFWVFTCINCTRTVPSLVRFDGLYRDRGMS